ncbi:MAG: subclass B3 metallo-beta-lactamase [Agriterribacter sp.]
MINRNFLFIVFFFLLLNIPLHAQTAKEPKSHNEDWSKPFPAFRIAGNVYYVGTYDLASYLIVTGKGNILINTGLAGSLPLIKQNIADLGFNFRDIKILLTTQAHYDHLGAMAAIKKETGAQFWADAAEEDVLKSGGATDYELSNLGISFDPVIPDSLLKNNAVIQLGNTKITMLHHPGHTKGSCSYMLTTKDEKRSYIILIANMPSIIINRKFSEVTAYPGIEKDYAYTLKAMRKLKFDIWVASHSSQFNLNKKHKPGDGYNPPAFFDYNGYIQALDKLQQDFVKKQQE